MTKLRALAPLQSVDEAVSEAWQRVASGYDTALEVSGLPDEERNLLTKHRSYAYRIAGASHLAVVPTNGGE